MREEGGWRKEGRRGDGGKRGGGGVLHVSILEKGRGGSTLEAGGKKKGGVAEIPALLGPTHENTGERGGGGHRHLQSSIDITMNSIILEKEYEYVCPQ